MSLAWPVRVFLPLTTVTGSEMGLCPDSAHKNPAGNISLNCREREALSSTRCEPKTESWSLRQLSRRPLESVNEAVKLPALHELPDQALPEANVILFCYANE